MAKKAKSKNAKTKAARRGRLLTAGTITIPIGSGGTTTVLDPGGQWNTHIVANLIPDTDEFVYRDTNSSADNPRGKAFNSGEDGPWAELTPDTGGQWVGDSDGMASQPTTVRVEARFVGAVTPKEQSLTQIAKGKRKSKAVKSARTGAKAKRTAKKAARKRG